jgi:hypothetical protein
LISNAELGRLHEAVERALAAGSEEELTVIGWGEISLAVGWPSERPEVVAKRLPRFPDRAGFERYRALIDRYVALLAGQGVRVVATELRGVPAGGGGVIGYAVQPVLVAASLGPAVLAAADPAAGHPLVGRICELAAAVVSETIGFDAQLSNWVWQEGEAAYFDVSTPLLSDELGRSELDPELLIAAYPAVTRPALRRFVAPTTLARYHDLRLVFLDLAGNLIKERLEPWIPVVIETSASYLEEPLTPDEIRRDHRSDARLWRWVQRIRRSDRAWHRLRGKTYPFLIPGETER